MLSDVCATSAHLHSYITIKRQDKLPLKGTYEQQFSFFCKRAYLCAWMDDTRSLFWGSQESENMPVSNLDLQAIVTSQSHYRVEISYFLKFYLHKISHDVTFAVTLKFDAQSCVTVLKEAEYCLCSIETSCYDYGCKDIVEKGAFVLSLYGMITKVSQKSWWLAEKGHYICPLKDSKCIFHHSVRVCSCCLMGLSFCNKLLTVTNRYFSGLMFQCV